MTTLLFWAAAATALMADAPRVIYTKSFPGSTPAFVSITVERSGAVAYKEAAGDDPETFQLEEEATAAIFDLAQKLDHFNHPIEYRVKGVEMWVGGLHGGDEGGV